MKQLGGIDATFLYMETPETPMHVAGLTLYEPPADLSGTFYDHFKEFFLTRLHLAPIFEKRLARTVLETRSSGMGRCRRHRHCLPFAPRHLARAGQLEAA